MSALRRILCWVIDHEPFYSHTEHDPQSGYLMAYELSCTRCGKVLDTWSWRR